MATMGLMGILELNFSYVSSSLLRNNSTIFQSVSLVSFANFRFTEKMTSGPTWNLVARLSS